jgi:hypothetical protein
LCPAHGQNCAEFAIEFGLQRAVLRRRQRDLLDQRPQRLGGLLARLRLVQRFPLAPFMMAVMSDLTRSRDTDAITLARLDAVINAFESLEGALKKVAPTP